MTCRMTWSRMRRKQTCEGGRFLLRRRRSLSSTGQAGVTNLFSSAILLSDFQISGHKRTWRYNSSVGEGQRGQLGEDSGCMREY